MPADDLVVTSTVRIARAELVEHFTTSGGPGGQHANKAASRVELRFYVESSGSLSEPDRALILERCGSVVQVVVDESRSQMRNRQLAEQRLAERLAAALVRARPRRPSRPTRGAQQRRLEAKSQRSALKASRRRPTGDGD